MAVTQSLLASWLYFAKLLFGVLIFSGFFLRMLLGPVNVKATRNDVRFKVKEEYNAYRVCCYIWDIKMLLIKYPVICVHDWERWCIRNWGKQHSPWDQELLQSSLPTRWGIYKIVEWREKEKAEMKNSANYPILLVWFSMNLVL